MNLEQLESRTMLAVSGLPLRLGGNNFDTGKRIVATPDGGFIEAGLFSGTVDFNPGAGKFDMTSQGDSDIFIAKYSSTGAFQWAKQIGGTALSGKLRDEDKIIDIDANPARSTDVFLNGVGADPSEAAEYVNDLIVNPDGSIVLCGDFVGQVDFDPGKGKKIFTTSGGGYYDAFVLKLNSSGSFVWADQFGGQFTDTANAIATDSSGNIFVTGLFSRIVDFVKGNSNFQRIADGRADGYLLKMTSGGAVKWVDTFGGDATAKPYRDAGLGVAVDSSGNVVVVGTFAGTADFDPSKAVHNLVGDKATDGFIAKYNTNGGYVNAVAIAGRGYDGITNVAIDSSNNIIITGYFQGQDFDVDPGPGTHLLTASLDQQGNESAFIDTYVEKLNSSLKFQWATQMSETGSEFDDQIAIDSSGNIIVGGSFYGTGTPLASSVVGVDKFEHDLNDGQRFYSYDAFLWKLNSNGTTAWARSIGGPNDDFGGGVGIESDGSILFTGRFQGFVDFDTGAGTKTLRGLGFGDAFITQFDSSGNPEF